MGEGVGQGLGRARSPHPEAPQVQMVVKLGEGEWAEAGQEGDRGGAQLAS